MLFDTDTRGDGKQTDVIRNARGLGCNKVGQTLIGSSNTINHRLFSLLPQSVISKSDFAASLIGVNLNVVIVDTVGWQNRHHTIGCQPTAIDDFFQHGLRFAINIARGLTHHRISQDRRERTGQIPGLKKRTPINVVGQRGQIDIAEMTSAHEARLARRMFAIKRHVHLVFARRFECEHGQGFLARVLNANSLVVRRQVIHIFVTRFGRQQGLRHRN